MPIISMIRQWNLKLRRLERIKRCVADITLVKLAVVMTACADPSITVTDFSKTILLKPERDAPVTGLIFKTKLDATSPITLNIGCNGLVQASLTIPPNQKSTLRNDWYSQCAELTFSGDVTKARSMSLSYEFAQ